MTPDSLAARLLQTFLTELEDQLGVLDAELVALERDPEGSADRLAAIFRVFHSLKGAARVAGAPRVEAVCHALETLLADVRAGRRTLGTDEFALLFRAVDALGDAGHRLREQRPLDDAPLAELERQLGVRFTGATGDEAGVAGGEATLPPPATPSRERGASDAWTVPAAGSPGRAAAPPAGGDAHELVGAEGGAAEGEAPPSAAAATSVRVEAEKLDALMNATGDLLVTAARADGHPESLEALADELARWGREWRRLAPAVARDVAGQVATLDAHAQRVLLELARVTAAARDDARALVRVSDELGERVRRLRLR
ncbi:MAG TPA: Hpt domain-containing protein, partial [Gemmatimonadaceae bacterium]